MNIAQKVISLHVIFLLLTICGQAIVLEKGNNITVQMEAGIRKSIKDASINCTATDRSCFTQVVGLKIQNLYGKSWNVHLLEKATTMIKGKQYSHERWITLINQGEPAYSYYIFKPIDCSKPLNKVKLSKRHIQQNAITVKDQKQYWGSSMTESLKSKIKNLIQQAYKQSQLIQANTEYIQNKLGPGRWQVIIWNTQSFDYMNTCMYASYFGLLVGVQRGATFWSYYLGRMSLI